MGETAASSQAARLERLPRTEHGWIPITLFDKAYFHEGQGFLVQLSEAPSRPVSHVCEAQWMQQDLATPLTFVGEWRYVEGLRNLEPVAFQPMPRPSPWPEVLRLSAILEMGNAV